MVAHNRELSSNSTYVEQIQVKSLPTGLGKVAIDALYKIVEFLLKSVFNG